MNTLMALTTLINLTNAALSLLGKAQEVSKMVAKAQSENRDLTAVELDSIIAEDDVARIALNDAILKNK